MAMVLLLLFMYSIKVCFGGSVYELNPGPANWFEAVKTCTKNGSHLASLDDVSTIPDLNLHHINVNTSHYWIGLSRHYNGSWVWSDGSTYNWSDFYIHEEHKRGGDCVQILTSDDPRWYVAGCWKKQAFLCQYTTNETKCAYQVTQNSLIVEHFKLTGWADSIDHCKYMCDTSSFCQSFQHSAEYGLCYYNDVNRWNTPEAYAVNSHWDYYHKTCVIGRLGSLEVVHVIQPSQTDTEYTTMDGMRTMVCREYTGEETIVKPVEPIKPTKKIEPPKKTETTEEMTTAQISDIVSSSVIESIASSSEDQNVKVSEISFSSSVSSGESSSTVKVPTSTVGSLATTQSKTESPTKSPKPPKVGEVSGNDDDAGELLSDALLKQSKENALNRKRTSMYDGRVSSAILGTVAIMVLLGVVVLVIYADDGAVLSDCRKKAVVNIHNHRNEKVEKSTLDLQEESKVTDQKGKKLTRGSYGSDSILMNNLDTSLSISDNLRQRGMMNFLSESVVNNDILFKSSRIIEGIERDGVSVSRNGPNVNNMHRQQSSLNSNGLDRQNSVMSRNIMDRQNSGSSRNIIERPNSGVSRNGSIFLVQEANSINRPQTAKRGSISHMNPSDSFVRSEVISRGSFTDEGSFKEVEMTMNPDGEDTESVDFPPL